ncbi:MAG: molecular chaperone Hsp90 [Clostridiales bacterium]|nr:molecular chaperone Hsp90 [Clostridiales bacterium]
MTRELANYVMEKSKELIVAPSCSAEAKAAANSWIEAAGTEKEAEETKKYLAELEEDVMSIDDLIGLLESDMGTKIFGAERAAAMIQHSKERKAAGAAYCDCPACAAGAAILEKKEELL